MNKRRLTRAAAALLCTGLIVLAAFCLPMTLHRDAQIPGLSAKERTLLRIWAVNAPGGGQAWLKTQLQQFEKQHPGVSTYLRTVTAEELTDPEALLADVVLFMPGDVTSPEHLFMPLAGEMLARDKGLIREELLRCGRWQTRQHGLPLCYAAWILAIDSALEPGTSVTPAPTTLLGKPAASSPAAAPDSGYPLEAASRAACALQSPGGAALFTLGMMLDKRPPLPDGLGSLSAAEVYAAFQKQQCATAMLTTGQATAFSGIVSSGSGFPFRIMTAKEVITDQVWLAGVTENAPREAALLLSHLTSSEAQKALSAQGLHTVRGDLTLYAADMSAQVEQAAKQSLSAINAYIPVQEVQSAAWQFFCGNLTLDEALLPIL